MFYENFKAICLSKGTTMTACCKALGISSGLISSWKNGAVPRGTTLKRFADYLGTTPEALLADTPPQPKAPTQPKGSPWDSVLSPSALQVALTFDKARPEVQFAIRALLGPPNEEPNSKSDLA